MAGSSARVSTPNGSKYLQQLCKHWGHRFEATHTPVQGRVDFGAGEVFSAEADEAGITLHVETGGEAAKLAGLEKVVEDHLKRFAFREELAFSWVRAA